MNRQRNEFRVMQQLSHVAAPYHMQMMVKMEQMRERRHEAEALREVMVLRRQAAREQASARQRVWERLQASFRPARQVEVEPEPC